MRVRDRKMRCGSKSCSKIRATLQFQSLANGFDKLAQLLLEKPRPLSISQHEKLRELLRNYFFIGGMPEAVKIYRDTNSFRKTTQVHERTPCIACTKPISTRIALNRFDLTLANSGNAPGLADEIRWNKK